MTDFTVHRRHKIKHDKDQFTLAEQMYDPFLSRWQTSSELIVDHREEAVKTALKDLGWSTPEQTTEMLEIISEMANSRSSNNNKEQGYQDLASRAREFLIRRAFDRYKNDST